MIFDAAARRTLIVECEPPRQPSAVSLIREAGHHVAVARSFGEAKRLITATRPDLVVTDVRLGPYNGLQLLWQRFFADPRNPSVVIDETEDPVNRREAERVGAEYLVRDRLPDQLPDSVARSLGWGAGEVEYGMRRRWTRYQMNRGLGISIGETRARLRDACYGGCRIEGPAIGLDDGASFEFAATSWPSALRVEVMWARETSAGGEYGVRLIETAFEPLALWKSSVDRWSAAG